MAGVTQELGVDGEAEGESDGFVAEDEGNEVSPVEGSSSFRSH